MGHIPSALSMFEYLYEVFKYIKRTNNIVIGKPFGAQAYYAIWEELGWIKNCDKLSHGVKSSEIDFVKFSDETLGNSLGVGIGLALSSDKLTYINLSDSQLQMGQILEALLFINQHKLKNVIITVDYNNSQVLGKCSDIIDISSVEKMITNFKIYHVKKNVKENFAKIFSDEIKQPTIIFIHTHKGGKIRELRKHEYHYKKIDLKLLKKLKKQTFKIYK